MNKIKWTRFHFTWIYKSFDLFIIFYRGGLILIWSKSDQSLMTIISEGELFKKEM